MRGSKWAAAIGGACISLAIANTAIAEMIYACINNSDGTTRIVSSGTTCKKNEHSLYWNQQGPQGDQGLQGERGLQGETGPRGPSDAYYRYCSYPGGPPPSPPIVCSLSELPAGMYAVTGQVLFVIPSQSPIPTAAPCFLSASEVLGNPAQSPFSFTNVGYSPDMFGDLVATGTLAAATDVLAGESVWLSCGAIAKLFHLRLTAIRVENLENQTGAP